MKNKIWNETVKNNFNNASANYLSYSNIQKHFADKIVYFLKDLNIQKGEWIDLGSGTGLLADEIEKVFSTKNIIRIDFSKKMLLQNKDSSTKILWDLNNGLPPSIRNCPLMTSNFCIHWLDTLMRAPLFSRARGKPSAVVVLGHSRRFSMICL